MSTTLGKLLGNQTLDENKIYMKLNLGKRWVLIPSAVGDAVMIGREGRLSSGGQEKALRGSGLEKALGGREKLS
jgi:hypothetical protein